MARCVVTKCDPYPPAPGISRAVLKLTQDGQQLRNVLHFRRLAGAQGLEALEHLGGSVELWWRNHVQPVVANSVSLTGIDLTDLSTANAAGYTRPAPANGGVGGVATQGAPNAVTIAMTLRTNQRGRSFRGRIYHVGLHEALYDGNRLTPLAATSFNGIYEELLEIGGSADFPTTWELVVLSYYANCACRAAPVATKVTSVSNDGYIDIQRRRLPGRGA
jgi:hypothetical protein